MEKYRNNFERRLKPGDALKQQIKENSESLNQELSSEFGMEDLLDDSGAIRMDSYVDEPGFSAEKIKTDQEKIKAKEIEWSGINDENVRDFYRKQHNAENDDQILQVIKEEKEKGKGYQMELLVTALFQKAFNKDFLVVRASDHDDYFNGIDNVLINKETGETVCAFDEVHDHKNSDRANKKVDKIKKIAKRGGTTFEYGLKYEDDKLKKAKVENLPVFYLSLHTDELNSALKEMGEQQDFTTNQQDLCKGFIDSLLSQCEMLKQEKLSNQVIQNLNQAIQAIEKMKNLLQGEGR